ncbi:MAG: CBS domain-containing protein [Nitrosarchaeum sp.]
MLPEYIDIIKLRKKYNMSTRELATALFPDISASWISKVENNNLSPTYVKIKKIADYFEKVEQKKGVAIGEIAQKIISFKIGDDIKKINTVMSEKGISQVLIKQGKEHLGMLTDKIILRILELGIKNLKVTGDFLDPLPPKIQHDDTINKVMSIFDLYSYIFVEKNGHISGIVTRQDMTDAGFKTGNP